jgi:hypothetical protein
MSAVWRKTILVVLLVVVASAFAYETLVVRRRAVRIQHELMELVNDTSHTYTEDEITQLVGEPNETIFESNRKKIIKYSWRGLTGKSYDVFVAYRNFRGVNMISDVSMKEPSSTKPFIEEVPPAQPAVTVQAEGSKAVSPTFRLTRKGL